MSSLSIEIPEIIRKHLEVVIKTFGLETDEETMERLINGWLEKEEAFKEQMFNMGMEETDLFACEDERAALALTYSGSLITIGPLIEGLRKIDYTSIGFRQDVPERLTKEGSSIIEDVQLDKGIKFHDGPIKQTSPLFKIVVCPDSYSAEEQEDMIEQATTMIIDSFSDINHDTILN
ncbi:MAG: hypothetical protein PF518_09440 [Spirochaetaceae bacterium]|jgi:hypothetical protein|nr:hypothetical protein [Spirochaetaceae bacterium]